MLSFNKGRRIAAIRGGNYDKKIVHTSDLSEPPPLPSKKEIKNILKKKLKRELTVEDIPLLERLIRCLAVEFKPPEPVLAEIYDLITHPLRSIDDELATISPLPNTQREVCYVAGPSGSGKSHYCAEYIRNYKKIYPDNRFILFSKVDDDKPLDELDPIRIPLDHGLLKDPIFVEDLKDSIVLFDDTDTIQNPHMKKYIDKLKEDILETGRHHNIYVMITSHLISDYKSTRKVLNESQSLTIFPRTGNEYQIRTVLNRYLGLSKHQIDRIMHLPSRWVTILKQAPLTVLHQKGIYLL